MTFSIEVEPLVDTLPLIFPLLQPASAARIRSAANRILMIRFILIPPWF